MPAEKRGCRLDIVRVRWLALLTTLLILVAIAFPVDPSDAQPKGTETEFLRKAEWLRSLDLFADVLQRVRSDHVDKPDSRKLLDGAISGIVKLRPSFRDDPVTSKAREALAKLPTGTDGLYAGLVVFGDFMEGIQSSVGGRLSGEQMIAAAIDGMLGTVDAHSQYIPPERFKSSVAPQRGDRGGIGIEMKMDNGAVKIVSLIAGGPAAKGGLQPEDRITHIDGLTVAGLTVEQAADELAGAVNSPVSLTIERKGRDRPARITLIRQVVYYPSIVARVENDIGYIKIRTFYERTNADLAKTVDALKKALAQRVRGYVLDLRDNTGGLFDQCIAVADAFLDHGAIVLTLGRVSEETQAANARPGDIVDGMPLVVLVNGGTAMGAAMLAAALKDNGRATVIGSKSSGYGTVQTIIPLGGNGAIRLTTARLVMPSGARLEGNGVVPDVEVAASAERGKDSQLDAALRRIRAGKRP